MSKKKGHLHAALRSAALLPGDLHLDATPARTDFETALATSPAGNPCQGKPAGTPCMVYPGSNGNMVVCTCDDHGNCVFPG